MTKPRFALAKRRAEEVLQSAGVREPPVDPEAIARQLGASVRYLPYKGGDGMSGMLSRREGVPLIGVNVSESAQRQRFTIAHELGHLTLHAGELHVDPHHIHVHRRDRRSSTAEDVEEIEANQFAAHLLMPTRFLEADLHDRETLDLESVAAELADRYGVSVQAMTLRLAKYVRHGL